MATDNSQAQQKTILLTLFPIPVQIKSGQKPSYKNRQPCFCDKVNPLSA